MKLVYRGYHYSMSKFGISLKELGYKRVMPGEVFEVNDTLAKAIMARVPDVMTLENYTKLYGAPPSEQPEQREETLLEFAKKEDVVVKVAKENGSDKMVKIERTK